jgi:hypothetical protein
VVVLIVLCFPTHGLHGFFRPNRGIMQKLAFTLVLVTAINLPAFGQQMPPAQPPAASAQATCPIAPDPSKSLVSPNASLILSAASIAATLLGVLITLWWRARIDFELKAAEIVLSSRYPRMAKRRAEILEQLFPNRLPKNFSSQFDATNFPGILKYEMTLELFKAISSKLETQEEIEAAWLELFPEVSWKATAPNNSAGAAPCSTG